MNANRLILLAGAGAAALSLLILNRVEARYEEPRWTIFKKKDNVEVRKYPRLITASVTVYGTDEKAANTAFSILAGYIFGKNTARKKIAMTVPVTEHVQAEKIAMTVPVTTRLAESSMTMSFYMPSEYDLDSLPEPVDRRIQFAVLPPRALAAIRFSGLAKPESISRNTEVLLRFIDANGLTASGEPLRAFYNPPWTLPFLRRNEIWIPVELPDLTSAAAGTAISAGSEPS